MIQTIADTAREIPGVKVLYTRNPVVRFAAMHVKERLADAVLGLNSDFLIFEDIPYIPIDSVVVTPVKTADDTLTNNLTFELFTSALAADMLGLEDPEKLFPLSVLLGNPYTEPFVSNKYNIAGLLHIRINPKYPDSLVVGVVTWLNKPDFASLKTTSPLKELIEEDKDFARAIEDSQAYFDLTTPNVPEGTSNVRQLTDKGELPIWAVAIEEGSDFWADPQIDDYTHPVLASKATVQLRKIFYAVLGRTTPVKEHQPIGDAIVEQEVEPEREFPKLEKFQSMNKRPISTFLQIVHAHFPHPPKKTSIDGLPEPLNTIALSLRFLISLCFTDVQAPHTLLPEDAAPELKAAGVVGAPPLDLFELKALSIMALGLSAGALDSFHPKSAIRPRLRRAKIAALYQTVVQHVLWLEQLLFVRDKKVQSHRLFDGELFGFACDHGGDPTTPDFAAAFGDDKVVTRIVEQLPDFISAILAPFPPRLFETFIRASRALALSDAVDARPQVIEVKTAASTFAGLLDSDDDEYSEGGAPAPAPAPPPVVVIAPPPPPPSSKKPPKKKVQEDEDEDLEAFLREQAQKKSAEGGAPPPPKKTTAPPPPAKKKPHIRKVETAQADQSKQVFGRESKNELKRQLKQQVFDYN
jgi:hypothetical protein